MMHASRRRANMEGIARILAEDTCVTVVRLTISADSTVIVSIINIPLYNVYAFKVIFIFLIYHKLCENIA